MPLKSIVVAILLIACGSPALSGGTSMEVSCIALLQHQRRFYSTPTVTAEKNGLASGLARVSTRNRVTLAVTPAEGDLQTQVTLADFDTETVKREWDGRLAIGRFDLIRETDLLAYVRVGNSPVLYELKFTEGCWEDLLAGRPIRLEETDEGIEKFMRTRYQRRQGSDYAVLFQDQGFDLQGVPRVVKRGEPHLRLEGNLSELVFVMDHGLVELAATLGANFHRCTVPEL